MMVRVCLSILLCTSLLACAKTDRSGRELTQLELAAIDTCNSWLTNELRGTVGRVDLDEGVVLTDEDSIDIAWNAQTNVGNGPILCSTNPSATKVIEANIDGIEVSL
jgi:hypothetical protein